MISLKRLAKAFRITCLNPSPMARLVMINYLRNNTTRCTKQALLLPTAYSIFDIHKTARLQISGRLIFGFKKYRGSRLETSLWMDEGSSLNVNGGSIYHGCDIQIFKNAKLDLGKNIAINRGAQIICQDEITVGDGCLISRDVVIRDNDGGHTILSEGYKKSAPVHIGSHVWIGQGAIILKGVTIGDGVIIGAGSVVMSNVKPKALVMADPARTFAKEIEWEIEWEGQKSGK